MNKLTLTIAATAGLLALTSLSSAQARGGGSHGGSSFRSSGHASGPYVPAPSTSHRPYHPQASNHNPYIPQPSAGGRPYQPQGSIRDPYVPKPSAHGGRGPGHNCHYACGGYRSPPYVPKPSAHGSRPERTGGWVQNPHNGRWNYTPQQHSWMKDRGTGQWVYR